MIELLEVDGGVIIPVKAQPGARRNAIVGEHAGMLKVSVSQKPDKGKANEAIVALLAKTLGVSKSVCQVRSGHSNSLKRIFIAGISVEELRQRLSG